MTAIIEDAKKIVIDEWGTLNTAASPQKLPKGHSPANQNVWVDEKPGSVVTANGYIKLGETPSGNPATLLLHFFKTSDGSSQLIVSDNETIWYTTNYVDFTQITTGLAMFFQLRAAVIRDKVWFTNGSDSVMTWDGSTLATLDGTSSTPDVPTGKYIAYHDERIWIYGITSDLSAVRFSSVADSSGTEIAPDHASAWPTDNEIQISEGDADVGTGIFLYRGYLFCSKQYSIWRIVGFDEYTYTRVKTRSSTGTRFQESIQTKDNLVHFIGVDGLYVFDGEESVRISDIIDPASADDGVFAFRNLQQPLLSNKFWNVSETADFNAGTVPGNLSTSGDELSLVPADDTTAQFNAGTHDDTTADDNAGNLQLDRNPTGGGVTNIAPGKTPGITVDDGQVVGGVGFINDESEGTYCGGKVGGTTSGIYWSVLFGSTLEIGRVKIGKFYAEGPFAHPGGPYFYTISRLEYYDGSSWNAISGGTVSIPSPVQNASTRRIFEPITGGLFISEADYDISFSTISCQGVRFRLNVTGTQTYHVIKELYVYLASYESDGKFISKSIDYGSVPASFGALAATITANGETYQFFTQSSDDGSTWDAESNVSNGSAIGSTLRRYLRWGVYLNSSTGANTPVVDKVYVGGTYISAINDTGGNILQWGAFQLARNAAGQTVNAYFRAAATAGGVSSASWTAIVPGAIPNTAISNQFIQVRIEMSTTNATQAPSVQGFTVNWVLSSSSGAAVLQNVGSLVWLNRYWLTAATLGADENDVILVLGKSTFKSPWQQKDFKILSMCRFQDIFVASASDSGNLYRLEYGYSKDGAAMDSFYETRDEGDENFVLKGKELIVTADRSGPYSIQIGYSIDGGATWTEKSLDLTRESGESLSFTKRFNVNYMSDSVRFRVRNNAADQPFAVDEIRSYYRLSPQRGEVA